MQGGYRRPFPIDHDMSDYRDPEPPPTPIPPTKIGLENWQKQVADDITFGENCVMESLLNMKSRTSLFDLLNLVGNLDINKVPTSKKEVQEKQNELLRKLPKPELRIIYEMEMPPFEYLLFELHEDGFMQTKERLTRFTDIDDAISEYLAFEPCEITRSVLRHNKSFLKIISEILKQVEYYYDNKMKEKEFTLLLYTAYLFSKFNNSWTWLSYELYLLAAEAANNYSKDQGYGCALIHYLMGKLLYEKVKKIPEAIAALWVAHRMSLGQSWTADCITGNDKEVIHYETCCLLYEMHTEYANQMFAESPDESIRLTKVAIGIAKETGNKEATEEAILNLTVYLMKHKQSQKAVGRLKGLIDNSDQNKDHNTLCNSYLLLALCYKNLGRPKDAFEYLTTLMNYSMRWSKDLMFAAANRYLGEYHLYQGYYSEAMIHLDISYGVFSQYDMLEDMDIVGFLYGIARSYMHKALYMNTLVNDANQAGLDRIINWKNHSIPFWDEDETVETKPMEKVKKMRKKYLPPQPLKNKPILPPIPKLMQSIEEKCLVNFQVNASDVTLMQ